MTSLVFKLERMPTPCGELLIAPTMRARSAGLTGSTTNSGCASF